MKKKILTVIALLAFIFFLGYGASLKACSIDTTNKATSNNGTLDGKESKGTTVSESIADEGNKLKEGESGALNVNSIINEAEKPKLPGNNSYFNGFKRQVSESYDDVSSVTDGTYILAIGTYYDEGYYQDKIESSEPFNEGRRVNGCLCKWGYKKYQDIEIGYANYNPIIRDYSGENVYLGSLILNTPRFMTSKGIHVGSTIDEMRDAYHTIMYDIAISDGDEEYYGVSLDGVNISFYYDWESEKITRIKISF